MATPDPQSTSQGHEKMTLVSIATFLLEAEESLWRLAPGGVLEDMECDDVGFMALRHGNTVSFIHGYFSNFESRKCCLNLAAGRQRLSSVRVVSASALSSLHSLFFSKVSSTRRDAHLEDGVIGKESCSIQQKDILSEQEYRLYKSCLLTARFPRLSVPSMPPDHALVSHDLGRRGSAASLLSLADSISICSIEEMDTSIIPSETLVDLVRQLFGLSTVRAKQFEKVILEQYGRKSDAKILAEEFASRLAILENNKSAFYHPSNFSNQDAYRQWKQKERQNIADLLEKFWTSSLPKPLTRSSGHEHSDYRSLLHRLISFEGGLHLDTRTASSTVVNLPVSSAAARLLKEFALRYGIGDLYLKVVHLEYLSENFENEIWFIMHASNLITAILDFLPDHINEAIIVSNELSILTKSIDRILGQCKNSLTRIHRLFLDSCVSLGLSGLIDLLSNALCMKSRLTGTKSKPLEDLLFSYAKENFQTAYERYKLIAFTDLDLDPLQVTISPKMLNRVLSSVRDQVNEYNMRYSVCFAKYFDLGRAAAKAFYTFLLEDIEELCASKANQRLPNKLDLSMLSLAYRLAQLDQDWKDYISVDQQKWRLFFGDEIAHWIKVISRHTMKLVLQSVGMDKFTTSLLAFSHENGMASVRSTSTVSSVSLTPSAHSAFNAVKPIQGTSYQHTDSGRPDSLVTVTVEDVDTSDEEDDGNDFPNLSVKSWHSMSWQSASVDFHNENLQPAPRPEPAPQNSSQANFLISSVQSPVEPASETRTRDRPLLVSGSVIDIVVLINRCLVTMETLCSMLLPCQVHHVTVTSAESDFDYVQYARSTSELLINNMYEIMYETVEVYADNLLCMDLCGVYTGTAKSLVGSQLVERLKSSSDHIWGCRHMTQGKKNCFEFIKKKSLFLADKFEPVVQEMCTRINNISQVSAILNQFVTKAKKLSSHFYGHDCQLGEEKLDQCKGHLKEVHDGLVHILAYRVHLFFKEAYQLLLHLSVSFATVDDRLSPLIQFLDNHLVSIQAWLLPSSFLLFAEALWDSMVKTIESEVINLRELLEGHHEVKVILQSIIAFLRLFSRFVGQGKVLDSLSMKVESVSFWLHLYTQSTVKLIDMYEVLATQGSGIPDSWKLSSHQIKWIRNELHNDKKSFSGHFLKGWLERRMDDIMSLSTNNDEEIFTDAEIFAQHLLDCGLMVPMETTATPPSSTNGALYPDIVCYSQQNTPFIGSLGSSLNHTHHSDTGSESSRESALGDPEIPDVDASADASPFGLSLTYSSHGDLYAFHDSTVHYYHFRTLGLEDTYPASSSEASNSHRSNDDTQMELYHQKNLSAELMLGILVSRCRTDPLAKDFLMELPLEEAERHPWLLAHKQPLLLGCFNW